MSGRTRPSGAVLGLLLGWIMTLGLFLLFVEIGLRLLSLDFAKPLVSITQPDPDFGWVKRPSTTTRRSTSEFSVTYDINALGLRDDATLRKEKPAGTQRVLFVGDSFVQGYTVSRDDLFVDLVEKAFAAEGRPIEAVNGGTEGWSTDQEVIWLAKEGLSFAPDVVVLCFFQNDVWGDSLASYTGLPKPRFARDGDGSTWETAKGEPPQPSGWFATHTCLGGFVRGLKTSTAYASDLVYRDAARSVVLGADEAVVLARPPAAFADGWARTETALRSLAATCAKAKTKLLFVAIPSREQVEPGAKERWGTAHGLHPDDFDPDRPSELVLAAAARAGIAGDSLLDARPALRAAAAAGAPSYFAKDFHLDPAGNRVLARAIVERLCGPAFLGTAAGGSAGVSAAAAAVLDAPAPQPRARWPFIVGAAWILLSLIYAASYRDEKAIAAFAKVGAMVGAVVLIVWGFRELVALLGPTAGRRVGLIVIGGLVAYIGWKMLPKFSIIREVYGSFLRRGHWYMIPLLVAMLSIGGLLVVASSSPFIAPFIYTLF